MAQRFRNRILQRLRPSREIYFLVVNCDERVDMIRHENITADPSATRRALPRKIKKTFVHGVICEDLPTVSAGGNEVPRRTRVYQLKPMKPLLLIFVGHQFRRS